MNKCSLRSGRAQFQSISACLSRKSARVPGDSRAKRWQVACELFVKQLRSYYPQPLRLLIHWDSCSAEFLADHVPAVTLRPPHGLVPHASALSQRKRAPGHFGVPVAPPLTPMTPMTAMAREIYVVRAFHACSSSRQELLGMHKVWPKVSGLGFQVSSAVWWSSLWVPM